MHGPLALSHKLSDLKAFRDLLRDELKPKIDCEDRDLFLGYFDKYFTLIVNQGKQYGPMYNGPLHFEKVPKSFFGAQKVRMCD
ncbi:hypothetical protein TB2_025262 [Malus domestica]